MLKLQYTKVIIQKILFLIVCCSCISYINVILKILYFVNIWSRPRARVSKHVILFVILMAERVGFEPTQHYRPNALAGRPLSRFEYLSIKLVRPLGLEPKTL